MYQLQHYSVARVLQLLAEIKHGTFANPKKSQGNKEAGGYHL